MPWLKECDRVIKRGRRAAPRAPSGFASENKCCSCVAVLGLVICQLYRHISCMYYAPTWAKSMILAQGPKCMQLETRYSYSPFWFGCSPFRAQDSASNRTPLIPHASPGRRKGRFSRGSVCVAPPPHHEAQGCGRRRGPRYKLGYNLVCVEHVPRHGGGAPSFSVLAGLQMIINVVSALLPGLANHTSLGAIGLPAAACISNSRMSTSQT